MDAASTAAGGLVGYVRSVVGDIDHVLDVDIDLDEELATVIILVDSRVPPLADFPLLLTWDEVSGWALRVETDRCGDTTAVEFLGQDILPEPVLVQRFLREAVGGGTPGLLAAPVFRLPNASDDLEPRLAHYCN